MKPVVAHYRSTWMRLSENWIATQVEAITACQSLVLAKRIRNQHLLTTEPRFALERLPFMKRAYNRSAWHLTGFAPYFREVCSSAGVRAVHAWFGDSGVAMLPLARQLRLPLITSFLGADFTRGRTRHLRRRYRALFEYGTTFLAEGPTAADRLRHLGCPAHKVRVARIAIDVQKYDCTPPSRAPGEPLRVLMAARFTEKKGLPDGVEAFCQFLREGGSGMLAIAGAGNGAEGARIETAMRQIVHRHGCADAVDFLGWKRHEELLTLIGHSDVFMHPSVTASDGDAEGGHPVILTEAAALGVPLIATQHCDIPEIVRHGRTGWLVPERGIDDLAAALARAYRAPELAKELGLNARALVEQKYDVRTQSLDSVYTSLAL